MIKDWKGAKEIITDFKNEFNYTKYGYEYKNVLSNVNVCVELDKPLIIYTGQKMDLIFEDRGTYYYLYFGQGEQFPKEKIGLAWLADKHSIFFFERPFKNKVANLIRTLLPEHLVDYDRNDIEIDGTKNGASLRTGLHKQIGDRYYNGNDVVEEISSEALSGMIYILRWNDLEGLNKVFKGNEHHEKRLYSKSSLSTLGEFLEKKGITKEKFIELLEKE